MAFEDYNKQFDEEWHQYPVETMDLSTEGAVKRFTSMPGPKEVFNYALMGLPKFLPLTQERITIEGLVDPSGYLNEMPVEDFLTSAITEIEMDLGCNLSETVHFHTVDYIEGMDTKNYYGIKLPRWPATSVVKMSVVYPHATSTDSARYMEYTMPKNWVTLVKNKVNIVVSTGSTVAEYNTPGNTVAGGMFSYAVGYGRGAYRPNAYSIIYKAGFNHDKMPALVADLIKTWAAIRYLNDISVVMFPVGSVSNSLDGISQSVTINMPQMIQGRLESLEKKKDELKKSFKKQFGNTVSMTFIGT